MSMALHGGARSGKVVLPGLLGERKSSAFDLGQQPQLPPNNILSRQIHPLATQVKASLPPNEEECLPEARALT